MSSTSASVWIGRSGERRAGGVAAVDDQRGQARGKDHAQVGEQAIDGTHPIIVGEYNPRACDSVS